MNLLDALKLAVQKNASDILLTAGLPLSFKREGTFEREPSDKLSAPAVAAMVHEVYDQAERDIAPLLSLGDDDFSFAIPGLSRFRVNAFRQRGSLGAMIRLVSFSPPDRNALNIPDQVMALSNSTRGLLLVTGPAGSGKTTTLACLIDEINSTRSDHIVTIEDPIEYLHPHKKSIVTQRELSVDTMSYEAALRAALRQTPDVILLGEMRDSETMKAAVTAAETGHLVISTLHTIGAVHTINRIIDAFPAAQQQQIRLQLAMVLKGVISQQLLPGRHGSVVPAFEVMIATNAIRSLIREAKTHQMESILHSSAALGMMTMDASLLSLAKQGTIAVDDAVRYSLNSEQMQKRLM